MNKFCSNCGTQLPDGAASCPSCGKIFAPDTYEEEVVLETMLADEAPVKEEPVPVAPVGKLKTNRGLLKFILLSLITFGIYGLVVMSTISTDINTVASRYDGKKTMHYCLVVFIFSWLTLGIVPLVWMHRISARIGAEANRRNLGCNFGAGTFWGWYILGSFIYVGPFIYYYRLFKTMNRICADYNVRG